MSRKITEREIFLLKKWNELHPNKYISIEAYQDMLDWIPEYTKEQLKDLWISKEALEDIKNWPN